ncbi:DUF1801 domain-containing protein [Leptospira sarikeiensis]|uniref:DUF1801 domain-containing protein n=1 Tax=Leptospira sarikeiensis TaxID=2484943 RepID=A0A4R9K7Q6_9LEPT|nr:DUF1801 domain-containing protein [Leptospira sarikeiensis]TGL60715.1 DUF1801 domain-containing protein [Leptospira sarikeiensis]
MPAKKKTSKPAKKGIKYQDKSPGQPELVPIFNSLKKLMKPYKKGSIKERGGTGGQYGLVSEMEIEIKGKKKPEVYFAGLLVQKGYVGFYFMPVYAKPEMKRIFQPELLKCLKGKSCFYIKKKDPIIFSQIKDALKLGYEEFKKKGWAK